MHPLTYSKSTIQQYKSEVKKLVKEMGETRDLRMQRQILDQITEYNVIIWAYQKAGLE